jgi:hypothetical protein
MFHNFWLPDCTFQWCFYGGNYIGIFWGFLRRSFDCWEPQLSKNYLEVSNLSPTFFF